MNTSQGQSQNAIAAVLAALDHRAAGPILPKGELFLGKDFLDYFFSDPSGDYFAQVVSAARLLGLSLVGVDLNGDACETRAGPGGLEDYFVVGCLNGPVSRVIESQGFFEAMTSVHRDRGLFPDAASLFVEKVERTARFASGRGFRALAVADDIAGTGGLFFSPDYFAQSVLPVYGQAARIAKERGLRAFFHSDGNTRKVIELFIKAGYDCIHPVDAQAGLDVHDLSKEFGPAVSFMGHIDIMGWREDRVRLEIDRAEKAFRGGGLILGSSCGISMASVGGGLDALYPGWRIREKR
jgi:uroporphyrinogen decarboxylase